MRFSFYVLTGILLGLFNLGQSYTEKGTCGGDCLFSEDCAEEAGDQGCRCSYFHCRMMPGACGGGCISDSQCSSWSGDQNCVCGTLYECVDRYTAQSKGYQTFAKFMLSARGSGYQQKITKMLEMHEAKTNMDRGTS